MKPGFILVLIDIYCSIFKIRGKMRPDKYFLVFIKVMTLSLLLFICVPEQVFGSAQNESEFPVNSTGPINFDMDICQYAGIGDSTRLEIFYSVYLMGKDSTDIADYNSTTLGLSLKILDESGALLDQSQQEKKISFTDSLQRSQNTTYIDLKDFNLAADSVTIMLTIEDKETGKSGYVIAPLKIRHFDREFSLSDLYFVSHVQKASGKSVFERHGIMMVPRPSRIFFISDDSQNAFIYYEINNLTFDKSRQSFYDAYATVFDVKGEEVFKNTRELIKIGSTNSSRIEVIPIGTFDNGIYRLLVQVIDRDSGTRQEVSGRFRILKEGSGKTDILPMSDEEAQKYYDQIKYIATEKELEIYKQLNPQGKQDFLIRFWRSRDPNPNTPENEFMIEHFRRMAEAERRFKGGINSDMGRVYIKYGPPLDIERRASGVTITHSVEKWIYAIQGRVEFIFVDRIGDGKFIQVC